MSSTDWRDSVPKSVEATHKVHYPNGRIGFHPLTLNIIPFPKTGAYITQHPFLQYFILDLLTQIHNTIFSPVFRKSLDAFAESKDLNDYDKTLNNVFNFFVKGGSAIKLHEVLESMPDIRDYFPFEFEGDIDTTVIVNPESKHFGEIRAKLFEQILTHLLNYSVYYDKSTIAFFDSISRSYVDAGLALDGGAWTKKINFFEEALSEDDFILSERIYNNFLYRNYVISDNFPFIIEVHPNLTYRSTPLGLATIRLKTRTKPSLDVIDFSFPSRMYKGLDIEWKSVELVSFSKKIPNLGIAPSFQTDFLLSDELSTYIEHRVSAKLNSRVEKQRKRTARANRLRNTVIHRLRTRNTIKKNRLNYLRSIPNVLPNGSHIRNIISNIE